MQGVLRMTIVHEPSEREALVEAISDSLARIAEAIDGNTHASMEFEMRADIIALKKFHATVSKLAEQVEAIHQHYT